MNVLDLDNLDFTKTSDMINYNEEQINNAIDIVNSWLTAYDTPEIELDNIDERTIIMLDRYDNLWLIVDDGYILYDIQVVQ